MLVPAQDDERSSREREELRLGWFVSHSAQAVRGGARAGSRPGSIRASSPSSLCHLIVNRLCHLGLIGADASAIAMRVGDSGR